MLEWQLLIHDIGLLLLGIHQIPWRKLPQNDHILLWALSLARLIGIQKLLYWVVKLDVLLLLLFFFFFDVSDLLFFLVLVLLSAFVLLLLQTYLWGKVIELVLMLPLALKVPGISHRIRFRRPRCHQLRPQLSLLQLLLHILVFVIIRVATYGVMLLLGKIVETWFVWFLVWLHHSRWLWLFSFSLPFELHLLRYFQHLWLNAGRRHLRVHTLLLNFCRSRSLRR